MKKDKFLLALLSAVMLMAIVCMAVRSGPEPEEPFPLAIQVNNVQLDLWSDDGENYYAFLPGYAEVEDVCLLSRRENVMLNGQLLSDGLGQPETDKIYQLSWQENGQQREGTLCLLSSGGVATVHVDTRSGSMDYIHEKKGNAERGSLQLYDEQGELNFRGTVSAIRGRGNSTWVVHDKKPYHLELTEEADLLGMGAAKKWLLLADALDGSGLRNKIVYDFAAKAGLPYTPQAQWAELYLNGEYAGLYLLCEKPEIDPQRIDLTPDGSLITLDRDVRLEEDQAPYFVTDSGQHLQIRDSADIAGLKSLVQNVEDALLSADDDRWMDVIDADSWVRKYLIEEIFGNYDAGFQSQYFFAYETGANAKLYAGPVWDYDASMGNPDIWSLNSPRGLFAWRPEAMAGYETPWLHSLYQKPQFRERLAEEYADVFLPLLEELLTDTVAGYVEKIDTAYRRNQIRWNVESAGLRAEAEHITSYMQERAAFLSELWLEEQTFCILRLQEGRSGGYYGYYAVTPGTVFEDLPDYSGENFLGWYREDTDTPFDPRQPITEDLCLYPRYEGDAAEKREEGRSLKDLILTVYHYVPAAVMAVMGLAAAAVSFWLHHSRKKKKREYTGVR